MAYGYRFTTICTVVLTMVNIAYISYQTDFIMTHKVICTRKVVSNKAPHCNLFRKKNNNKKLKAGWSFCEMLVSGISEKKMLCFINLRLTF